METWWGFFQTRVSIWLQKHHCLGATEGSIPSLHSNNTYQDKVSALKKGEQMADQPINSEPAQPEVQVSERIQLLEDRVFAMEQEVRLGGIESRLGGLEAIDDDEVEERLQSEGEGQKELRLAIAQLLRKDVLTQAAADLMKGATVSFTEFVSLKGKGIEAEKRVALHMYYSGLLFSVILLGVITLMIWHEKLSKEVAAGLLGSLIGYWYGRDKPKG